MRRQLRVGMLFVGWVTLFYVNTPAQAWTDKATTTPSLIQIDFGPYGSALPGDGDEYCVPTSAAMSTLWLYNNGYTQLSPVSGTDPNANSLNLVRVMAGLMGSSATGGTGSAGQMAGISDFLSAKGLSGVFTLSHMDNPTLAWMNDHNTNGQVVNFSVIWYAPVGNSTTTYSYSGGHELTFLGSNTSSSPFLVTLNNAYPSTFENVPNVPGSNPETVQWESVPDSWDLPYAATTDRHQIVTSVVGPGTGTLAVIGDATSWEINEAALEPGWTPQTWTLTDSHTLNTNGGDLDVIAPLAGAGGIAKQGEGTLRLLSTNATTGANSISNGTLSSTQTSGTPFGTGSMSIEGDGVLAFQPDDSTPTAVNVTLASGSGSQLIADGGGSLLLEKGNNISLTVTVGGNTDGTTANVTRGSNFGTLHFVAADLGNTEKVLVNGTGGNLPAIQINTGIVSPWLIAVNRNTGAGSFVNYDATNGFIQATAVESTGLAINSATASTVYSLSDQQTLSPASTATIGALVVQASGSVFGDINSEIILGTQAANDVAGLILNGGAIHADLNAGASELVIHALGDSAITRKITGSGGVSISGPAAVTLSGNNGSSLTGAVNIQGGATLVADSGGATGGGPVDVRQESMLYVTNNGTVTGTVSVQNTGTLGLAGGTVSGPVTVTDGGTVAGFGSFTGNFTMHAGNFGGFSSGANGPMHFYGNVHVSSSSDAPTYTFTLMTLVDNATTGLAPQWNELIFHGDNVVLGTSANALTIYFDFGTGLDPDSGNSFWDAAHTWSLWDFTDTNSYDYEWGAGNFDFDAGTFEITQENDIAYLKFNPNAVPEPGTWMLLGLGLGVMMLRLNRTRFGSAAIIPCSYSSSR